MPRTRPPWRRYGLPVLAGAVAAAALATPAVGAMPVPRSLLERELTHTLAQIGAGQARLSAIASQTADAISNLNAVDATLRTDAALAVRREAAAQASAQAVARMRVVLAQLQAAADRQRLAVRTVLQGEEVASADPLGSLAPLLGGGSLTQAVSMQSEMAMVSSANARALARAGRAVLAARREARRLERALASARAAAAAAARARAQTQAAQARQSALVASLTRDRATAAQVVASLEAHAAGLRQAIAALLAAARSGRISNGTLLSLVAAVAQAFHVDPALVWAVVMVESGGNPHAQSSTGAQGLMQLEPGTAAALGVANAYNAQANLRGGTSYLASLIQRYHGNLALALAAYNLGPGAVPLDGPVPAAARAYVQSVLANWQAAQSRFPGKG